MKDKTKGIVIIVVCLITLISMGIYLSVSAVNSDRHLTIDGTIIDVVHLGKSDEYRYGEVFEITFDSNETIIVESASYGNDLLDLSKGQHVVIRLYKTEPEYNWDIKQIIIIN